MQTLPFPYPPHGMPHTAQTAGATTDLELQEGVADDSTGALHRGSCAHTPALGTTEQPPQSPQPNAVLQVDLPQHGSCITTGTTNHSSV